MVGSANDRRAVQHLARNDHEATRQAYALAVQVDAREHEMRSRRADVDADSGQLDVVDAPDGIAGGAVVDVGAIVVGVVVEVAREFMLVHDCAGFLREPGRGGYAVREVGRRRRERSRSVLRGSVYTAACRTIGARVALWPARGSMSERACSGSTPWSQNEQGAQWAIDGYEQWLEHEDVPVAGGLAADLIAVETKLWPRLGVPASVRPSRCAR